MGLDHVCMCVCWSKGERREGGREKGLRGRAGEGGDEDSLTLYTLARKGRAMHISLHS